MGFIYEEIKSIIKNRIDTGVYKPSEKLPSERSLAEEFSASRMTIRQAIAELEKEGFIIREKGRGSFVSTYQFSQQNLKSFTETLKEQGFEPRTVVIEKTMVHNVKEIASKLDQPIDMKFYKVKRLRLGDGIPMALETVYIPECKCENLFDNDLNKSLYALFDEMYEIEINSASYHFDAVISNRGLMKNFNVEKPVVLLKIFGVTKDINGSSIMYEESYYRSDLYNYQVDIFKRGE